jgi:hypothetical protein
MQREDLDREMKESGQKKSEISFILKKKSDWRMKLDGMKTGND